MGNGIRSVLIAGYGVMGQGIVRSFVRGGHETLVLSRDPSRLSDLPAGVQAVRELPETAPDLVLETIPERMDLKRELYARIEDAYGAGPVIASNTSSLPLQAMADGLRHPERFIGIHYFQPADAYPMVEVIRTAQTSDATLARVEAALGRNGQSALVLNKPVEGFLVNRLQHAILNEAYWMIEEGIVTPEDVDNFAKWMFGPRMCVTGMLEQKDISGLQTNAIVQQQLVPTLHLSGKVSRTILDKIENGDLGVKTGRGFYDWRDRDVPEHKRRTEAKLAALMRWLQEN
ncbi:MAG: 3-hydroxyacyl-CoA dehydrogenase family protein [Alphaproteobacteria bacterium]